MKKIIATILLLFVIINIPTCTFAEKLEISSKAAILIDAETGKILYEKNIHKILYPASTTKIITAILAIENGNLNDTVVVDREATLGVSGSHIALEPGEIFTLEELLYALLIESANDAAKAIAIHISGSVEQFAELMNEKATSLGAINTNFVNPNGLPDDNHVTTAYDLALIANHAMKNETFRTIVSNYLYTIGTTNKKSEPRYLKSHNRLLYSDEKILVDGKYVPIKYYGAIGVKTGYTIKAHNCLVSAATRNNQTMIAVVLKASGKNVFIDTHKLLNYGFDNFTQKKLSFQNEFISNISVKAGNIPLVTGIIKNDLVVVVPKNKENSIIKNIKLYDNIVAPLQKGQTIGKADYLIDGEIIGSVDIVSAMSIDKEPIYSLFDTQNDNFVLKKWWSWIVILILFGVILIKYRKYKIKRRRRKRKSFFS